MTLKSRHHSLLYFGNREISKVILQPAETKIVPQSASIDVTAFSSNSKGTLLPTALVTVYDAQGVGHRLKCLLDSGSMTSFVTQSLVEKLRVPQKSTTVQVKGIALSSSNISTCCDIDIYSSNNNFRLKATCLVMPKITSKLPCSPVSIDSLNIPSGILLADPDFDVPSHIDIQLGANYFWEILRTGQHELGSNKPTLHKTKFGWIVSGPIPFVSPQAYGLVCNLTSVSNIDCTLQKCWKVEEIPDSNPLSPEELFCKANFEKNKSLDSSNRFIVMLPFKEDPTVLGNSLDCARR